MREKFNVYGMHCAMCSSKIEKKLNSFNGVKASVKLDSGEVVIDYNPDQYKLSMFKKEIKKLGYKCDNSNETFEKVALVLGIVITIFFLVGELRMFGLNIPAIFNNPYLGLGLASIVLFTLGLKFYYHAFFDIKNMSLGMDVLVCLGVTSAYGLSIYQIIKGADMYYFASVSMIITLVSIGKLIEAKVKHNTSYTVSMLSSKISSKANLIETDDDGLEEITEIEANNVKIGTETSKDVEHIKVTNCYFFMPSNVAGGYAGISIESADGANVEDVYVDNIYMKGISSPLLIWLGDRLDKDKGSDGTMGSMKGITVSNITAYDVEMASAITGCKHQEQTYYVENVKVANFNIYYRNSGEKLDVGEADYEPSMSGYPEITRMLHKYILSHEKSVYKDMPVYGLFARHINGLKIYNLNVNARSCNTLSRDNVTQAKDRYDVLDVSVN